VKYFDTSVLIISESYLAR